MPELPEVEIIRRGLAAHLVGRRIDAVDDRLAKLRGGPGPRPLTELEGRIVTTCDRHGKFLMLRLDDGGTWVIHLGMTGKLLFTEAGAPERPHTHLRILFEDESELRFVDPRRFGALRLYPDAPQDVAHYGLDALDPAWDDAALAASLRRSKAPLKSFLLDQTKVAGVGNIYACEALWRAGLSPRRKACNTPSGKIPRLRQGVIDVLEASIAAGGTSFNDYVDSIGQQGSFLFDVAVFQREGLGCPRCATPIVRISQSGRSTFYCPRCQR